MTPRDGKRLSRALNTLIKCTCGKCSKCVPSPSGECDPLLLYCSNGYWYCVDWIWNGERYKLVLEVRGNRSRCGPRLAQLINGVLYYLGLHQCQQLLNLKGEKFYDNVDSLFIRLTSVDIAAKAAVIWVGLALPHPLWIKKDDIIMTSSSPCMLLTCTTGSCKPPYPIELFVEFLEKVITITLYDRTRFEQHSSQGLHLEIVRGSKTIKNVSTCWITQ